MLKSARKPASEFTRQALLTTFRKKHSALLKIYPRDVGEILKSAWKATTEFNQQAVKDFLEEEIYTVIFTTYDKKILGGE